MSVKVIARVLIEVELEADKDMNYAIERFKQQLKSDFKACESGGVGPINCRGGGRNGSYAWRSLGYEVLDYVAVEGPKKVSKRKRV